MDEGDKEKEGGRRMEEGEKMLYKSGTVKLISAEGFEFIIDRKAAIVSNTLRNMLSSAGNFTETELGEVNFPEISTPILEKVCQYFYWSLQFASHIIDTISLRQRINWPFHPSLVATTSFNRLHHAIVLLIVEAFKTSFKCYFLGTGWNASNLQEDHQSANVTLQIFVPSQFHTKLLWQSRRPSFILRTITQRWEVQQLIQELRHRKFKFRLRTGL